MKPNQNKGMKENTVGGKSPVASSALQKETIFIDSRKLCRCRKGAYSYQQMALSSLPIILRPHDK